MKKLFYFAVLLLVIVMAPAEQALALVEPEAEFILRKSSIKQVTLSAKEQELVDKSVNDALKKLPSLLSYGDDNLNLSKADKAVKWKIKGSHVGLGIAYGIAQKIIDMKKYEEHGRDIEKVDKSIQMQLAIMHRVWERMEEKWMSGVQKIISALC